MKKSRFAWGAARLRPVLLGAVYLGALAAAGCGERDSRWDESVGQVQSYGLSGSVALVDRSLDRLLMVRSPKRDGIDVIDHRELAARLKRREVIVLDVRPEAEFAAGHIAGARSVPIGELRKHLRALPSDAEVVAYCRGPYCVYADDAVRELNRKGFRARRLIDGFPEWKRAGMPVASGT